MKKPAACVTSLLHTNSFSHRPIHEKCPFLEQIPPWQGVVEDQVRDRRVEPTSYLSGILYCLRARCKIHLGKEKSSANRSLGLADLSNPLEALVVNLHHSQTPFVLWKPKATAAAQI